MKRKRRANKLLFVFFLILGLTLSLAVVWIRHALLSRQELPQLEVEVPAQVGLGDVITVSARPRNADSVSWRLLRNGWSVPIDFTDAGGTICLDAEGTYFLIGIARSGSVSTMHTSRITVPPRAGTVESGVNRRSLYSWSGRYIEAQNETVVHSVMAALDCGTIYQTVREEESSAAVLDFLDRRAADGHRVYYLCGQSDWATETDAKSMREQLDRVIRWNEEAENSGRIGFYGIQYDVEKLSSETAMNQVVENYKAVYAIAQQHGIKVEACIPYQLDTSYGFEAQLEDLIANGCDSIAVMNYDRHEIQNIETEVALCKQYGKGIVNITEMQPVGSHSLTSSQTYHDDGIEAVESMWQRMQSYFDYDIGFSYHYLNPILDLL